MTPAHLFDTYVLIDVTQIRAQWHQWSAKLFGWAVDQGRAAINPIIYSEFAGAFADEESLNDALRDVIRLPLPYESCFAASRAFIEYRGRGGIKMSPLPDFYIGAHAEVMGLKLVTRDVARFRSYFPRVELITPGEA